MLNWIKGWSPANLQKYNHNLLAEKQNKTDYEVELLAAWDKRYGSLERR